MTATPVLTINPNADVSEPATTPANHDDEESRYSWKLHCATAEGRAKYAYCKNPEPAALQELYGSSHSYLQQLYGSSHSYLQNLATAAKPEPVNHDDEESRYSWKLHCATAEGRAKYAYCQNPEPAALQELYGSSHSYLQQLYGSSHSYLQQLYGSSHSYLQNLDASNVKVMHLKDWCYKNDSEEAKKICTVAALAKAQKAPVATGEYSW
jgi:hypothetical protein